MPRFLVLIYGDELAWAAASQDWNIENGRRHRAFLDRAGAAVVAGGELVPSGGAVCIRGDDPPGTVAAGPFVQADKGIGGFYVIEADDLADAVRRAQAIPEASSPGSGIEIRGQAGQAPSAGRSEACWPVVSPPVPKNPR